MFEGVAAIVADNRSGGMGSNQEHFGGGVVIESADQGASMSKPLSDRMLVLHDPQTSGGLLVAVDPEAADAVARRFPLREQW